MLVFLQRSLQVHSLERHNRQWRDGAAGEQLNRRKTGCSGSRAPVTDSLMCYLIPNASIMSFGPEILEGTRGGFQAEALSHVPCVISHVIPHCT